MKIFYYTATGNSLAIAKEIGGELISIPQIMNNDNLNFEDDAIGVIFPIYGLEAPKKVQDFLNKASLKADYIFAIGTYGNAACATLHRLQNIAIKNGYHFDYLNEILMVDNFLPLFKIEKQIEKIPKKKITEKLNIIKSDIKNRNKREAKASIGNRMLSASISSVERFRANGKEAQKYIVDNNCVKCGICAQVCPAGNITVEDKVIFSDRCEQCEACVHMCPKTAIHIKNEKSTMRWRHPEVSLKEIIDSNKQDK